METLVADMKHALRTLRHSPVFAFTALLILTLAIGANTAIFSVVSAVLLKPVSFVAADRLVLLTNTSNGRRPWEPVESFTSVPKFEYWRGLTDVFDDVAAYRSISLNLADADVAERVAVSQVSEAYFRVFGATLALGRVFSRDEDRPGAAKSVVISEAFWGRYFGRDPNVLGRTVSLSGAQFTIVGVMSAVFDTREFGDVEAWVPFQLEPSSTDPAEYFQVAARLRPGVSLEQAQQRLGALAVAVAERLPAGMQGVGFGALPFQDAGVGSQTRWALWVLLAAVVLVLLIACANVASLLLVRGLVRGREMAIRAALGAGPWRVVRQLLTESALLSAAGGILGLALGFAGIRALLAVDTAGLPRIGQGGALLTLDWRIVAFTVGLTAVTSLSFGLAPALVAARGGVGAVMKRAAGSRNGGSSQNRLRSILVAAQAALAVVLLVGTVLLAKTSLALSRVDPGFTVDNVVTMRTSLAEPKFATTDGIRALATTALERIRALPGVEAAAASCCVPLQRSFGDVFNVVGRDNGSQAVTGGGDISISSGSYFATFEIPLLRGRVFDDRDVAGSAPVVVINRTMAERYWPTGDDPLQSQLLIGSRDGSVRQVVGIVDDVRALRLSSAPRPIMYLPFAQIPDDWLALMLGNEPLAWVVRTSVDPAILSAPIQTEVRRATGAPVTDVQLMTDIVSFSLARQRLNMLLMTVLGATALLLAAIGIYGLVAFSVQQRTHEIGIRIALGARAGQIKAMVLRQGISLVAIGVAVGLGTAFASSRLLSSILFGVSPHDPVVFVVVATILLGVGAAAMLIAVRRASRVDPLAALHYE